MRNKKLAGLLALTLLAGASYILGWSTLFTVSSVQITGSKSYLPIMIKNGEKLARVEPRAVGAMYEKYDFVKDLKEAYKDSLKST